MAVTCLLVFLAAPAHAATAEMHIVDGAPNPAQLAVDDGDTVMFFNDDDVEHTIFALGQPQAVIPAHDRTTLGPFEPAGARFDYRVDDGGAPGVIVVRGPDAPPPSPPPPASTTTTTPRTTTTAPPATATTEDTTTTTSTSTTVAAIDSSTSVAADPKAGKKDSSNLLAVLGFALLAAGVGGLVIALERSRRRRTR